MTTRPAGSGTQCIDRAPRSRRGVEHTPRMQFEDFSGLAQHDAAPGAMVEFRAQFLLERLDLLAQDRLADAKAHGRARECAGLRDGDEVFEVPQFHCRLGSVGRSLPRRNPDRLAGRCTIAKMI